MSETLQHTICQIGAHSNLRQQSFVGEFVYILTSWRDSKTAVTELKQDVVNDVKAVLLPELNIARL
jgi:hypothetical protein